MGFPEARNVPSAAIIDPIQVPVIPEARSRLTTTRGTSVGISPAHPKTPKYTGFTPVKLTAAPSRAHRTRSPPVLSHYFLPHSSHPPQTQCPRDVRLQIYYLALPPTLRLRGVDYPKRV